VTTLDERSRDLRRVGRVLVAVLSNPPTTSGARTVGRVEQARRALRCESVIVVNLFPIATYRNGEIREHGATSAPWLDARAAIESALDEADIALLGYGVQPPSGNARYLYSAQVSWLDSELTSRNLPTYVVGDGPRHPSRWQRFTSRAYPGVPFVDALPQALSTRTHPRLHTE
jgi:hypothetical protein